MTYKLVFHEKALKEWQALDAAIRKRLKVKLEAVLENPRIEASRLHGSRDRYKIKLMSPGLRLVYEVHEDIVSVVVLAVGNRERAHAYEQAARRFYKKG